jgi:hypothetical protein
MTAEIVSLDKYRKDKVNQQNELTDSDSENKSEVSKGVALHASSEQLHNIDNGEPI